ncbi:MAG: orotate phosphoribosyltransferase, partial [Bacillota bacterium]|nr:orotate phosphoribosyltransferase [Bacillota bacterium]
MKRKLAKALLEIEAIKLRGIDDLFTWVSGIKSPIYCDNRLTISYPKIRDLIATEIAKKINSEYPDVDIIAATATAGIPHGAWIAQKLNKPMIYVRGEKKKHGRGNQIEGYYESDNTVVLIEDLISTGKSSLEAVDALNEAGLDTKKVYGIFNYNFESMNEKFKENNMKFETLID